MGTANSTKSLRFQEEQHFRQGWVWGGLLLSTLPALLLILYAMYSQLVLGKPFGNNPMSDEVLIWFGPLIILAILAAIWLFWAMKLQVAVNQQFLHVRFYPFVNRRIPLMEIEHCEVRKYRPIREFGGWGIRYSFKGGKAYNASGNQGVQLVLKGNKKLLIGSQRAAELSRAIHEAKEELARSLRKG